MEQLIAKFQLKLAETPTFFVREFIEEIDWNNRFVGIKGARGVGKTTLLLQYAKLKIEDSQSALYVSLDDLHFRRERLYDLAERFVHFGGKILLLDEVHRYQDWSLELKNLFDDFSELRVIFTGSSIIQLSKNKADLSRRAVMYVLEGLSFREFLRVKKVANLPEYSLDDILSRHMEIAVEMTRQFRPLPSFRTYLQSGFYPFFLENEAAYSIKLGETINLLLESDIPAVYNFTTTTVEKLKTFLLILAESVPFKPNIKKLAEKIGVNRNTATDFLYILEDAGLLKLLHRDRKGITRLQKPEKVYLANPNLAYALNPGHVETGTIRETFFINQLSVLHTVEYTEPGDFKIDGKYVFEIGGKNKTARQIRNVQNAFVAADNLEVGALAKIPLWLFGFLY